MKTLLNYVVEEIQHRRDEQRAAWECGDTTTWNEKAAVLNELYDIKTKVEQRMKETGG